MNSRTSFVIISFIVSLFLWSYVLNSEPIELEKDISLVLIPPRGKAVNVIVPKVVKVKVLGSRAIASKVNFSEQKIVVDLADFPKDKDAFAVTFDANMLTLPFGLQVLEMKPKQLMVSFDREIRKFVPVRIKRIGDVGKDLRLVSFKHRPKKMFIKGPHELIKKIGLLETTPIDLSLLEGEGTVKVALETIDSRITIVDEGPVDFSYKVKPNKANITLKKVKIKFLTSRGRFKSSASLAALDVLVSDDRPSKIKKSEVRVIADIPDKGKGNIKIKLRANLPEGVHLLKIHPEYINVRLN